MGPRTRVIPVALERIEPWKVRSVAQRQAPHRTHHKARRDRLVAAVETQSPVVLRIVEMRTRDGGLELDVTAQIEPIRNMVQVRQDLGLPRIPRRPRSSPG